MSWRGCLCLVFSVTCFTSLSFGKQNPTTQHSSWLSENRGGSQATRLPRKIGVDEISSSAFPSDKINIVEMQKAAAHLQETAVADKVLPTEFVAETKLPTDVGQFRLRAYRINGGATNEFVGSEPCVIFAADKPPFGEDGRLLEGVPVRVHDQCMTSEVFRSQRCDCKEQFKMTLEYIRNNGGCIIYLQQEGRGIGIANKVAAYAMQDAGLDTIDANVHLGLPEDCRQYGVVPSILEDLGVASIQLITNNPRKIKKLKELGVNVTGTIPIVVREANSYNRRYLETKRNRMSHANFGGIFETSGSQAIDEQHVTPMTKSLLLANNRRSGD